MDANTVPDTPQPEKEKSAPDASNMLKIGRNIVRERFFFFLLLLLLLFLSLLLIWPHMTAILTAIALVVIVKPLYKWVFEKKWVGGNPNRATAVTILTFLFLIAIPVLLFIWVAYNQSTTLLTDPLTEEAMTVDVLADGVNTFLDALSEQGDDNFNRDDAINSIQEAVAAFTDWLANILIGLAGWSVQFFTSAVIVLVIMMVMLSRFKRPEQDQMAVLIPFPPDITKLYLDKIKLMIMAMFKGTFLLAILEGAAMGVVLFIAGVPYVFFLTILSMFLALLPMIGISLVAWPIGIILILDGQVWQGVFVIGAFLLLVANIDTVLRPVLVPKGAYLNPALMMLSVFGGLSLMGFIGLIYGPVIMILLVTSLEVYAKYIMRSDLEPFLAEDGSLDMEKLGLRETAEEERAGSALNVMQRIAKRFSGKQGTDNKTEDNKTEQEILR